MADDNGTIIALIVVGVVLLIALWILSKSVYIVHQAEGALGAPRQSHAGLPAHGIAAAGSARDGGPGAPKMPPQPLSMVPVAI